MEVKSRLAAGFKTYSDEILSRFCTPENGWGGPDWEFYGESWEAGKNGQARKIGKIWKLERSLDRFGRVWDFLPTQHCPYTTLPQSSP